MKENEYFITVSNIISNIPKEDDCRILELARFHVILYSYLCNICGIEVSISMGVLLDIAEYWRGSCHVFVPLDIPIILSYIITGYPLSFFKNVMHFTLSLHIFLVRVYNKTHTYILLLYLKTKVYRMSSYNCLIPFKFILQRLKN